MRLLRRNLDLVKPFLFGIRQSNYSPDGQRETDHTAASDLTRDNQPDGEACGMVLSQSVGRQRV